MPPLRDPFTIYDEEHAITYLRMLDADKEGVDWREVSRIVLHIDPDREAARQGKRSIHIARAKWMTHTGYRLLLRLPAWRHCLFRRTPLAGD